MVQFKQPEQAGGKFIYSSVQVVCGACTKLILQQPS